MLGAHEDEDAPQEVLIDDVVLDVVRVVLDAERQQVEDEGEQLTSLVVICSHQQASRSHSTHSRSGMRESS